MTIASQRILRSIRTALTADPTAVLDGIEKSLSLAGRTEALLQEILRLHELSIDEFEALTAVDSFNQSTDLAFFAGESEVKVLDPRKVEIVRCVSCAHTGQLWAGPQKLHGSRFIQRHGS